MKRPIALLASLLAVTVLATAATAAGGDSSDPLISLNYLQTTFTTKATSSIDAALDKSDQAAYAKAEAALRSTIAAAEANVGAQRADVFTESRLKQGDILSGTTGLQVIVLAGSVNVQFSSGAVVDVTTGSEVKSGAALAENHRYLVAEDTTALFTVTGKTAVVNYCGFYSIASSSSVDYPPWPPRSKRSRSSAGRTRATARALTSKRPPRAWRRSLCSFVFSARRARR